MGVESLGSFSNVSRAVLDRKRKFKIKDLLNN